LFSGDAIPDSAIHRWKFNEGSGTLASDAIGTEDVTLNADAIWASDANAVGGTKIDGDGTDDNGQAGTLGTFGSNMASDFAVALTLETTESGAQITQINNNGSSIQFYLILDGNAPQFRIRDGGADAIDVTGSTNVADGSKYRIVFNKTANSASGLEIYVNASQDSTTTNADEAFDNTDDFNVNYPFCAHNAGGSITDHSDIALDDYIIANDSLTSSEIQNDYDRQPWS
jgi:hypothetical protein